jgi:1,4-dihydroxy-2-naphthoate octaprenyltransferase
MFSAATVLLMFYFDKNHQRMAFALFMLLTTPVVIKLFSWFSKVRQNKTNANFENTMNMNLLASSCMNLYFIILIFNNNYGWF